jgi:ribosomal protein S18 acetylase RimI-like enzyme
MNPRPLDPAVDLPAVAALLGRTRARGGLSHPGGIQWWLRELGRDGFDAFVVDRGDADGLAGSVLIDDAFVVVEHEQFGAAQLQFIEWTAEHMRSTGRPKIMTHAPEGTELERELESRGFERTGLEYELMADTGAGPVDARLREGFRFGSMLDMSDDDYIEMHRAAWSDKRPSPYRRELHDRVTTMPQFRRDLVTVAFAPDGRGASYCIGWLDEQSQTLEIEPLGTHRDFRRLGLARALVREVIRRAAANGARHVLVWNNPNTNPEAYGLYTSAGMRPNRNLTELTKQL